MSRVERGEVGINARSLRAIATRLDVSLDELVPEVDTKPEAPAA